MIVRDSRTINLILPVGIGEMLYTFVVGPAQCLISFAVLAIELLNKRGELRSIEHIKGLALCGNGQVAGVAYLRSSLTFAAFLRSDDNDTIGSTRTVDGGC